MTKISKRHFLKGKETRKLMDEISKNTKIQMRNILGREPKIELINFDETRIFIVESKALLAFYKKSWIPTLIFEEALNLMPKIIVDMGAVPHVCNGADIMAPGIVEVEGNFQKGDLVTILDEKYKKSIAVGVALKGSEEIIRTKRGKVVKNVHFVGDKLWKFIKSLR